MAEGSVEGNRAEGHRKPSDEVQRPRNVQTLHCMRIYSTLSAHMQGVH